MGWASGKVLRVSVFSYAHLIQQILTGRKTSWGGKKGAGESIAKKSGIEREIWLALLKDSLEIKEQKETTFDKATDTETDNKLYEDINKDSRNLDIYQTICESSEGAQNASTEQQPNASDNLPFAEIKPCLDSRSGNAAAGKPSTKVTQQRQAIMVDILGAALLVVVVGTVGLARQVLLCIIL